jgi:hypothetical protein
MSDIVYFSAQFIRQNPSTRHFRYLIFLAILKDRFVSIVETLPSSLSVRHPDCEGLRFAVFLMTTNPTPLGNVGPKGELRLHETQVSSLQGSRRAANFRERLEQTDTRDALGPFSMEDHLWELCSRDFLSCRCLSPSNQLRGGCVV